jgi:amino acid adenylation domain-containing protein
LGNELEAGRSESRRVLAGRTTEQLVAETASDRGVLPAVRAPGVELSYAELDRSAASLAARVRPLLRDTAEPVVAVALERSPLFPAAVLGCWKAGAAYLPLDVDLPGQRIAFMLDDANVDAVVTERGTARAFAGFGRPVLAFDEPDDARAPRLPPPIADERRLAYVIYTSGSTGTPKGVAVEHRHLARYVASVTEACRVESGMHWAAVSSFTTDLAHTAVFVPLATGGCVHVLPKPLVMDPGELERYFGSAGVDALKITPGHLGALLAGAARPLPRRLLVLGGEPLPWELVRRIRASGAACAIYDHYGPTETTVGACVYRCDEAGERGTVPIGRPLRGVEVAIVADDGREAPAGNVGEIEIGGPTVARGYLGASRETGERFVVRRRDGRPRRVYRTGDLGRVLPDGNIEFLGRADEQVKVRGFRVEPAEIEAALLAHPEVVHAFVSSRTDERGAVTLVAHVATKSGAVAADELARFLGERLPEHMVPSDFVGIASVPLRPSGKVDRKALAKAAPQHEPEDDEATALEQVLVEIYRDVLGNPGLAPSDDFFSSGGDSLRAVEIVARVRDATEADCPVAYVFTRPTPRALAEALASPLD